MTALLALLLGMQGEPQIERIDRLAGDVNRPLLWAPLKVTVSCSNEFSGDLVAVSGFGFSVARRIVVKPGGRVEVLLPSLDPVEIRAGKTAVKMPRDFVRTDRLVIVDERLPYAAELSSTEKIHFQKISPEDLRATLPRGLLEAADLVLVKEPMGSALVAPAREEAEKAVSALMHPPASLELVDRGAWLTAPRAGWVPTKKSWTLFFATTYLFAAFLALGVVVKRFPRSGLACVGVVAVAGIAGYGVVFPRSPMWITGQALEVVTPVGEAVEHRVWFIQSTAELPSERIGFPVLVKPLFSSMAGAEDPFVIRVEEQGCDVEGLKLMAARPVCFGGSKSRAPSMRIPDGGPAPFGGAVVVRDGQPAGDNARSPEFEAWRRFVGEAGVFGSPAVVAKPSSISSSAADVLERPPIFIQRFR